MRHIKFILITILVAGLLNVCACSSVSSMPKIEGSYTYEHAFSYDMDGNHFNVHETGTMEFHADSTALDSARQVYTITFPEGDTATLVFNYISPSRWHLDDDTLFFAGIKESFRMETIGGNEHATELAQKIVAAYSGSIDYEYKFHLDTLTADRLQWSFTYRDGHSDTWQFYRQENKKH